MLIWGCPGEPETPDSGITFCLPRSLPQTQEAVWGGLRVKALPPGQDTEHPGGAWEVTAQ